MKYLSVCSGIEAASVAWAGLGWQCAAVAEIDAFACAVLAHRYPDVPNLGDFTAIEAHHVGPIDLLAGGTPCQSFSVAGKRAGLDDPRGNLTLEFLALARRLQPRWIVWENVPGVLSIDGGRTFGAFLGTLGQLGYGFAYRVLDACHFGIPQRRRRVFVVGCAGGAWQRAAAVLFERDSLRGKSAPSREARQNTAGTLTARSGDCDENDAADGRLIAQYCTTGTGRRYDPESETLIAFNARQDPTHGPVADALGTKDTGHGVKVGQTVRRLTPRECERLQGFPDDWTQVPYRGKPACDGPRYRAIGNSMAVPVMQWIGERIALVDAALAALGE